MHSARRVTTLLSARRRASVTSRLSVNTTSIVPCKHGVRMSPDSPRRAATVSCPPTRNGLDPPKRALSRNGEDATCPSAAQTTGVRYRLLDMTEDLLVRIRRQIAERKEAARAAFEESQRLQAALDALDAGQPVPTARPRRRAGEAAAGTGRSRAPRGE